MGPGAPPSYHSVEQRWSFLLELGARRFGFGISLDTEGLGSGGPLGVQGGVQGVLLEQGPGERFRESLRGVVILVGYLTRIRDAGS
jgi:hypothetical protein